METLHNQRVFCSKEDWDTCLCDNILFSDGGITLSSHPNRRGFFFLKSLDSGEKGFRWGRVTLEGTRPRDSLIRAYAYVSDDRIFADSADLDEYLKGLAPQDARAAMTAFTAVGASEDFIIDKEGRYLWLMLEFIASDEAPVLKKLRVHMVGDHMVDYLPAIYRKQGDFTKHFLSIFDSFFMDMEKSIYEIPARFDFENPESDLLKSLADWVLVDTARLPEQEIAERIRTVFSDYESLYTVEGVKRSVKYLTGCDALIIESKDVNPNSLACTNSELYRRLYGENPYKFFILLEETAFAARAQMEQFLTRMRTLIPANTEFELVLLKKCVQLDLHTYLGVNSLVSHYVPVVIDENTSIHYDTMIGGNEVEEF